MAINRTKLAQAVLEGKELADAAKAAGSKAKTKGALAVNAHRALNDAQGQEALSTLKALQTSKAVLSIEQCHEALSRLSQTAEANDDISAAVKALDTLLKAKGAYVTKTQDITDLRAQLQSLRPKMSPGAFRELIQALASPAGADLPSETVQ